MGCSAEQTRINARRSTGPKTKEGKAIVSRNGIKHGLLSQKPPVLETEEGQAFQGLLESLTDEWQPQTATERLCVEQIAMAQFRLYRLWATEAAAANYEMLMIMQQPVAGGEHPYGAVLKAIAPQNQQELLLAELTVVKGFIEQLTQSIRKAPTGATSDLIAWFQTLQQVISSASHRCPLGIERPHVFWDALPTVADILKGHSQGKLCLEQAQVVLEALLQKAQQYAAQLKQVEAAILGREQAIAEAKAASHALPDIDRFARYEARITHQLDRAIERLEKLQNSRGKRAAVSTLDISNVQAN